MGPALLLLLASCGQEEGSLRQPIPTLPTPHAELVEVVADSGVSDDVIRLGLLADLTGPNAAADAKVIDAQKLYWRQINEQGGLGGRQIDLVLLDSASDTARHQTNFESLLAGPDAALVIAHSSGTDNTRSIASDAAANQLAVVTTSRWSGWLGNPAVISPLTSYCLEAANTVSWLDNRVRGQTGAPLRLAILGDSSADSNDAVDGVRQVAAALKLDVVAEETVMDGEEAAAWARIQAASPSGLLVATSPRITRRLLVEAASGDLDGLWAGSSRSFDPYNSFTADGPTLELISERYFHSWPLPLWGTTTEPELSELVEQLQRSLNKSQPSPWLLVGWNEARLVHQAIDEAMATGDLRRASVLNHLANAVANGLDDGVDRRSFVFDLGGSTPSLVDPPLLAVAGGPDPAIITQQFLAPCRLVVDPAESSN